MTTWKRKALNAASRDVLRNFFLAGIAVGALCLIGAKAFGQEATMIGGRPKGCPWKYCGCGLARYLGLEDKRLNLAWSWARIFPRTSAGPGMVAVRHGHVMLLQSHVSGTRWIVRDYNGGRHLSWIHERDVRGYVFVNPHSNYAGHPTRDRESLN